MVNIKALKKLKKWILAEPRRYDQTYWLSGKASNVVKNQNPPCGTAGCLAGNACLMEGYQPARKNFFRLDLVSKKSIGTNLDVCAVASSILGLDKPQAALLFSATSSGWSYKAHLAFERARTPRGRAKAAAMELDRLIAEAEREQ